MEQEPMMDYYPLHEESIQGAGEEDGIAWG